MREIIVNGLAQVWQSLRRQLVGWQVDHKSERVLKAKPPRPIPRCIPRHRDRGLAQEMAMDQVN
jgi:hypothetical protein